jgi:hypothetical protein
MGHILALFVCIIAAMIDDNTVSTVWSRVPLEKLSEEIP